ncbi:MAG: pectate lyase [Planctomycetaceae bacterium]
MSMFIRTFFVVPTILLALLSNPDVARSQNLTTDEATKQLHRVIGFYRNHVGYEGAWLWRYAADLSAQEGEGEATRTSGWTQPPGTPTVGEAFLNAWRLTDDSQCLEAAIEAAQALVRSQLVSGGWSDHFDLAEPGRRRYRYRSDGNKAGERNNTTFDDNKTQSAMMLLMHVDEALTFRDPQIHEAVEYGLQNILAAQYPNGAWPQQFSEPPNAADFPVKKASYPKSWSRTHPKEKYTSYYTLNDNNMSHIVEMLLEANRIYKRQDCFDAARRTGDFFLLAQMPEPQPGWAQQYSSDMHPMWARKFEPAAITGGESQAVMNTLILLYSTTGDRRYVETLPKAFEYYERSKLADGKLARFYELQTNRPLYFTKDYELTYSDDDMPTHYSFKVSSKLDRLRKYYEKALSADVPVRTKPPEGKRAERSEKLEREARRVIEALDDRGAWVERGSMRHQKADLDVIDMRTFVKRLEPLARYAGSE